MSKKATIADQILGLLSEGDQWADEIVAGVSAQPVSIRACLGQLVRKGVIVRVKRGTAGNHRNDVILTLHYHFAIISPLPVSF